MAVVRVFQFADPARKVRFDMIAPAGFAILSALVQVARKMPSDVWITSATDGKHSGPTDPHYAGEAIDVRTNTMPDLTSKQAFVKAIIWQLREDDTDAPFEASGGWATRKFFAFLESPGQPNEHAHIQRRKNTQYP